VVHTPSNEWLVNGALDDGLAQAPGHWYLWQANWAGPDIDGCFNAAAPRTVVEVGNFNTPDEGTENHGAWYLIATAVPSNGFNFDRATFSNQPGGTGCTAADLMQSPVEGVNIVSRPAGTCLMETERTQFGSYNGFPGSTFFDAQVTLVEPNPRYFAEAASAPALIAGYQIMYQISATPPTSSSVATGGWLPVLDPFDVVAPKNALGVVQAGTAGPITISLPVTFRGSPPREDPTINYWIATRIVYEDASENPEVAFDPASGTATAPAGPQITSEVSGHCGPLFFLTSVPPAVQFDYVTATRTPQGVNVHWATLMEDDVSGFRVFRSTTPDGTEALTEAASWVDAHGANLGYTITDLGAGPGTYFYWVQELTSAGLGDRSETVRVEAASPASDRRGGASGSRKRGRPN
jgi:hypothetical protein